MAPAVRRFDDRDVTTLFRRQRFAEYLESLVQIGRYSEDARVVHALLRACQRVAESAAAAGEADRVESVRSVAERIHARPREVDDEERAQLDEVMRAVSTPSRGRAEP